MCVVCHVCSVSYVYSRSCVKCVMCVMCVMHVVCHVCSMCACRCTHIVLLDPLRDALDPLSHLTQLLDGVGFVIKLTADGLELFTSLKKEISITDW